MIEYTSSNGSVEITQRFTEQDFNELIHQVMFSEKEQYDLFEAAMIWFITSFDDKEPCDQIERITEFINNIKFIDKPSNYVLHKLAIIYGHAVMQPFYTKFPDKIKNTCMMYSSLKQIAGKLIGEDPLSLVRVQTAMPSIGPDAQDHNMQQQKHDWKTSNVIKYPGFILCHAELIYQKDIALLLEIYSSSGIFQFYKFIDFQLSAMRYLVSLFFKGEFKADECLQQRLVTAMDLLYNSDSFNESDERLIGVQYDMVSGNIDRIKCAGAALMNRFFGQYLLAGVSVTLEEVNEIIRQQTLCQDAILRLINCHLLQTLRRGHAFELIEQLGLFEPMRFPQLELPAEKVYEFTQQSVNVDQLEQIEYVLKLVPPTTIVGVRSLNFVQLVYTNIYFSCKPDQCHLLDRDLFSEIVRDKIQYTHHGSIVCDCNDMLRLHAMLYDAEAIQPLGKFIASIGEGNPPCQVKVVTNLLGHYLRYNYSNIEQQRVSALLDLLGSRPGGNSQEFNTLVHQYYTLNCENDGGNGPLDLPYMQKHLVKNQKAIIKQIISQGVFKGDVLLYTLQQSSHIDSALLDEYLTYIITNINNPVIGIDLFYQIVELFYNSYDISPQLCAKLNGQLQHLHEQGMEYEFYKTPGFLFLLMSYEVMPDFVAVQHLGQLLTTSAVGLDLVADMRENRALRHFHVCIFRIVLRLGQGCCQKHRKLVTKLIKYVLYFPYEEIGLQAEVMNTIAELAVSAYRDGHYGLHFLYNQAVQLAEILHNTEDCRVQLKCFLLVVLSCDQLDQERIAGLDYKRLFNYIKTLCAESSLDSSSTMLLGHFMRFFRSHLVHSNNIKQIARQRDAYDMCWYLVQLAIVNVGGLTAQTVIVQLFNCGVLAQLLAGRPECHYQRRDNGIVALGAKTQPIVQGNGAQAAQKLLLNVVDVPDVVNGSISWQDAQIMLSSLSDGFDAGAYSPLTAVQQARLTGQINRLETILQCGTNECSEETSS